MILGSEIYRIHMSLLTCLDFRLHLNSAFETLYCFIVVKGVNTQVYILSFKTTIWDLNADFL